MVSSALKRSQAENLAITIRQAASFDPGCFGLPNWGDHNPDRVPSSVMWHVLESSGVVLPDSIKEEPKGTYCTVSGTYAGVTANIDIYIELPIRNREESSSQQIDQTSKGPIDVLHVRLIEEE